MLDAYFIASLEARRWVKDINHQLDCYLKMRAEQ